MYVGIDVGAQRLHCVAIDAGGGVMSVALLAADELDALVEWAREARVVCIDAPAQLSSAPHRDDDPLTLSRKFLPGRCAEIALGREYGCWVPWVTPLVGDETPGWMRAGLAVFDALSRSGIRTQEIYPHAGFRELADRAKLPNKQTTSGATARVALLRQSGIRADHLEMWSHDSIDACLGALVALQCETGEGQPVGCGHDASAIWLPARGRRGGIA